MTNTETPSSNSISVIATAQSTLRARDGQRRPELKDLKVQELAQSLQSFLNNLDEVMKNLNAKVGGFEVDEMEVYAEISAEGKISLLGTGIETGAMGGLKLILRRPPKESEVSSVTPSS